MKPIDAVTEAIASELRGHTPWYELHHDNKKHPAWKGVREDARYLMKALNKLGFEVVEKQ